MHIFVFAVPREEGISTIKSVALYATHDSLYGDIPTDCNSTYIRGKESEF